MERFETDLAWKAVQLANKAHTALASVGNERFNYGSRVYSETEAEEIDERFGQAAGDFYGILDIAGQLIPKGVEPFPPTAVSVESFRANMHNPFLAKELKNSGVIEWTVGPDGLDAVIGKKDLRIFDD